MTTHRLHLADRTVCGEPLTTWSVHLPDDPCETCWGLDTFERVRCAKQPCECARTLPLATRACTYEQCPAWRCLGERSHQTSLIEQVRELAHERTRG